MLHSLKQDVLVKLLRNPLNAGEPGLTPSGGQNFDKMQEAVSPTSALRLNFDNLLAETTDPVPSEDDKGASAAALWDAVTATLPDCVRSHRVVSWIDDGLHTQPVFFKEVLCIKKVPCLSLFFVTG